MVQAGRPTDSGLSLFPIYHLCDLRSIIWSLQVTHKFPYEIVKTRSPPQSYYNAGRLVNNKHSVLAVVIIVASFNTHQMQREQFPGLG